MPTELDSVYLNNSVLFKVRTYADDGTTLITPVVCACSVYARATGATIINESAGVVGAGYAQYNWAGSATAGVFEAVLTVTLSSGVIKSEQFVVAVLAKPTTIFTYDISADIGKVRFKLGDKTEGAGPLPDGANLADNELTYLLTMEGSVMRAVAAACEMLATTWSAYAQTTYGPRTEALTQSDKFATRAKELRAQYGGGATLQAGVLALDFMEKDANDTTVLDAGEL
jgi:hypothetical protein